MSDGRDWYERAFDAPYLEVYAHRDAAEASRATRALIAPVGLAGRRLLDLGCGGGRYLMSVRAHGARPVGLDLSLPLLRAAQAAVGSDAGVPGLVRGNMLALPFDDARFEIVLSMFTSFGYFATSRDDGLVLAEMRRVLRPHGYLFIDLFNAARVRAELVPETRRRAGRFRVHERRHVDDTRNTVVKEIELREATAVHRYREEVRLWEADALEATLAVHGLTVDARWGSYDGALYDARTSDRLIVRARPRGDA